MEPTTRPSRSLLGLITVPFFGGIAAGQAAQVPAERAAASFTWGDFDADGLDDAFVVTPAGRGALLRNRGDGTLEDVTANAGLSGLSLPRFAAWKDLDRDKDLDLFVGTRGGPSLLLVNQAGTFVDATAASGILHQGPALEAGFLDYDRDGLPDLQVRTVSEDLLFQNLGAATFARVELGLDAASPIAGASAGATAVQPDERPSVSVPAQGSAAAATSETEHAGKVARTPAAPTELGRRPIGTIGDAIGDTIGGLAPGGTASATAFPACALALEDQAGPGCIFASSTPTLGELYPLSGDFYVDAANGFVGVNDTTPSFRLDVNATSSGGAAVRGDAQAGPTRGYVGVQGSTDFDGVTTADWSGLEIGVAGISTGVSTSDNYGVRGHANGVGVRGEWSGQPSGTYGELGTSDGIGLRAAGLLLAGQFLGSVEMQGTLRLLDAIHDHVIIDPNLGGSITLTDLGDVPTVAMAANGLAGGAADSELALYAGDGNPRITLDNEGAAGGGFMALWNSATRNAIQLFGDNGADAGRIDLYNRAGGLTDNSIILNARDSAATGSEIQLTSANGNNLVTVDLDGANGTTGQIQVNETDGSAAFRFLGNDLDLYNASGVSTINWDRIAGTKSAVVDTPGYGQRLLYCIESPEVWFEDFGGGRLANGTARVELDPMFLETVTIDEANPMRVYLTLTGDSRGVFVEKGASGFVIRELEGGTGSATFDWRVVAKRKGLESRRLDPYVDAREELGAAADAVPPRAAVLHDDRSRP